MKFAAQVLSASVCVSAMGQDVVVTVNPIEGTFSAEYFGPPQVQQIFDSISVRLTGDGPISILSESNVYTSLISPSGAAITGDGTETVEFVGTAPGPLLSAPQDSSNPFSPFTFDYSGSFEQFDVEFFSQTSLRFLMQQQDGNMVNANGSLGRYSFRIDIVPAPASAALLGFGGLFATRRRR